MVMDCLVPLTLRLKSHAPSDGCDRVSERDRSALRCQEEERLVCVLVVEF